MLDEAAETMNNQSKAKRHKTAKRKRKEENRKVE